MFLRQFYQIDGVSTETLDNYDNNISIGDVPVDCTGTVENTVYEIGSIRTLADSSAKL